MYSAFKNIQVNIYGESHAPEIGVNLLGIPKGISISDPTVYVPFAIRGKGGVSAQACFSSPFKVKNARNFVFEVISAVVDFSDIHNAEGFKLPAGYWHEALSETAWTGFFLKSMKVYFPEDFKLNDGADLTTAEVSNMFIDDYGFTGLAAVDNLVNKDLGNAGAHLEISKIAVEFYQDEFIKGELKGPVAGLACFAASSVMVLVPTPNGAGPWNLAIVKMLGIYGAKLNEAQIMSFVLHFCQTMIYLLCGLIAWIALKIIHRNGTSREQ